jgi:hypothetical protein
MAWKQTMMMIIGATAAVLSFGSCSDDSAPVSDAPQATTLATNDASAPGARSTRTAAAVSATAIAAEHTGITALDAALDARARFRADPDAIRNLVGGIDWQCPRLAGIPGRSECTDGGPAVFLQVGCEEIVHESDPQRGADAVLERLEDHGAWEVAAIARAQLTQDRAGFVMALRVATANGGILLYVTDDGRIVGLDNGFSTATGECTSIIDRLLLGRVPNPDYVIPPRWRGR